MSRWSLAEPYISENRSTRPVWTAALHYVQDNGATWFNKIELYADSEEAVELLQQDLLSFMNAQELLGVTHG